MSIEFLSLGVGTSILTIELEPWPFREPALLCELSLNDGIIIIAGHPDGRIEVSLRNLNDGEDGFLCGLLSPPIVTCQHKFAHLTVAWRDQKIEEVRINGEEVFPKCEKDQIVLATKSEPEVCASFANRNDQARQERRSNLLKFGTKPGRKDGGEAYLLAALKGEIEQVGDLLDALEQGREAHLAGLAARLRLLIADKPFGLLQHCAAFHDLPLIVYIGRNPELPLPLIPNLAIMGSVSGQPSDYHFNPIDLDVWLSLPALQIGELTSNHRSVIKAFGDTIGAHVDRSITMELQAYQTIRSQIRNRFGDVHKYVTETSRAALKLAKFVIDASDATSDPN